MLSYCSENPSHMDLLLCGFEVIIITTVAVNKILASYQNAPGI